MSALGLFFLSMGFGIVVIAAFALTPHGWTVLGAATMVVAVVQLLWGRE